MNKLFASIIIVLITLSAFYFQLRQSTSIATVTNFEECIAAGNPAMESYPRQCRHGDETFVEVIDGDLDRNPTSADNAPEGSMHNLPVPEAVSAVRSFVASNLGVDERLVIVISAYEMEWPDGCLGLAREGEACITVIVPGYEVTVQAQGNELVYRTNETGSVLRRQE